MRGASSALERAGVNLLSYTAPGSEHKCRDEVEDTTDLGLRGVVTVRTS